MTKDNRTTRRAMIGRVEQLDERIALSGAGAIPSNLFAPIFNPPPSPTGYVVSIPTTPGTIPSNLFNPIFNPPPRPTGHVVPTPAPVFSSAFTGASSSIPSNLFNPIFNPPPRFPGGYFA